MAWSATAAVVPVVTGEDRASVLADLSGPLRTALVGLEASHLGDALAPLTRAAAGPVHGGVDIALHDLAARRAGVPLAVLLVGRRSASPPT